MSFKFVMSIIAAIFACLGVAITMIINFKRTKHSLSVKDIIISILCAIASALAVFLLMNI